MSRRTRPGTPAPLDAVLAADRRFYAAERAYAAYYGNPKSGKAAAPPAVRDRYWRATEEFLRIVLGDEGGRP